MSLLMLTPRVPLRRRSSTLAIAVTLAAAAAAVSTAAPAAVAAQSAAVNGWGVPLTDVTPDPAIRYGKLANGMKYAIMRNATPKGTASVRLHFNFGSIGEAENERGLAHFIEHMAFNGTTNVPEGQMVAILERQGLKFGPDTNAMTGFDATMYMLDLPSTDAQRLDTAFMLMREVASEITFQPAAVDRERGVILGERRSRENAQLKRAVDTMKFTAPNTPYGDRLPIGAIEVIETASAATLKNLYQRYYRPENATFVFVGDADPDLIERRIKEKFGSWKGTGPAGAKLPRGTVDFKRPADFDVFVDPAIPSIVSLSAFRSWENPRDSKAERRNEVVRQIAMAAFNRRIERIANAPESVILGGGMSLSKTREAALDTLIGIVAKDGRWKDAVTIAEQELRRALQYGFHQSEIDVVRTTLVSRLAQAADQAGSRKNSALAQAIVARLEDEDFVTAPAWDAKFVADLAPGISVAEINSTFQKLWAGSQPLLHVSAKEPLTNEQVAQALAASSKIAVAPPVAEEVKAFAYDSFGPAGTIAEDKRIADLGVRTIRFANNVWLNIKKTDFEPGKVTFLVRMDGGTLAMPADKPGLGAMIANVSTLGATAKHNLEELKTITAGKQLTPGFMVAEDAFQASGTTNPAELALQMKLSAAFMTDPGYRAEAGTQWATLVPLFDKQINAQPLPLLNARLPYIVTGRDGRFGFPPAEQLAQRSMSEFKALYSAASANAPVEVTIVGDIDETAAIAAVATSFGALPKRALSSHDYAAARSGVWKAGKAPITLTHSGEADQAVVGAVWHTDDDTDYKTEVGMSVVAGVLDLMLTDSVREKLGASYGASVASEMSAAFNDFGYLFATSVVAPEKADVVDAAIAEAVAALRNTLIHKDTLERAVNPEIEKARRNERENAYWAQAIGTAQSKPARLDRLRKRIAILQAITPADIRRLSLTYLTPERMNRLRVTSEKLAAR